MTGFNRRLGLAAAILAFALGGPAGAQENLDSGKTGAQLYASDCAICHKNPATLGRGGVLGLADFLSEHYTASGKSASLIAGYVESVARPEPAGRRPGVGNRSAKGNQKSKGADKKPAAAPAGNANKPATPKNSEANVPRPPAPIVGEPKSGSASAVKPDKPKSSD
jgi:hypothetical protein